MTHLATQPDAAILPAEPREQWGRRHVLAGLALMAAGVFVTFDAWRDMIRIAIKDEEASHAFLVPVALVWLVWVRWRRLRHCRRVGTFFGPAIVAAGWFIHSYGDTFLHQYQWHGGAMLLVLGCLVCVVGTDVLWQFLPAFLAAFFIVPFPGRVRQWMAIPMGTVTAQVTEHLFMLLGVPVERSGNMLTINRIDVAIAEACNGLRMIMALFLVTFAFTFGTPFRWYTRLILLAAAPVSAVACNVIRLVPTVMLYGSYPGPWAECFHTISGWVMLVVSFLLLMLIMRLLRWALVPVTHYTLAYD